MEMDDAQPEEAEVLHGGGVTRLTRDPQCPREYRPWTNAVYSDLTIPHIHNLHWCCTWKFPFRFDAKHAAAESARLR
jgi:hypothetical protein